MSIGRDTRRITFIGSQSSGKEIFLDNVFGVSRTTLGDINCGEVGFLRQEFKCTDESSAESSVNFDMEVLAYNVVTDDQQDSLSATYSNVELIAIVVDGSIPIEEKQQQNHLNNLKNNLQTSENFNRIYFLVITNAESPQDHADNVNKIREFFDEALSRGLTKDRVIKAPIQRQGDDMWAVSPEGINACWNGMLNALWEKPQHTVPHSTVRRIFDEALSEPAQPGSTCVMNDFLSLRIPEFKEYLRQASTQVLADLDASTITPKEALEVANAARTLAKKITALRFKSNDISDDIANFYNNQHVQQVIAKSIGCRRHVGALLGAALGVALALSVSTFLCTAIAPVTVMGILACTYSGYLGTVACTGYGAYIGWNFSIWRHPLSRMRDAAEEVKKNQSTEYQSNGYRSDSPVQSTL